MKRFYHHRMVTCSTRRAYQTCFKDSLVTTCAVISPCATHQSKFCLGFMKIFQASSSLYYLVIFVLGYVLINQALG